MFCVHCGCSMNDGLKRARAELERQEMLKGWSCTGGGNREKRIDEECGGISKAGTKALGGHLRFGRGGSSDSE